jgi:cellulose synthase/poly-beta-1,6-N-acetylglucosamine synthase-like glycosyltransferase
MFVVEIVLFSYLAFFVAYIFLMSLAGRLRGAKSASLRGSAHKMAVLIPAYKEDGVIVSVAQKALEQNYATDQYDVVVIADSLQEATLRRLRELPIKVVEVSFEKSTKTRALNAAMAQIGDGYDLAVILDADNVMEPDFLAKVSSTYGQGYKAIQGRRVAKNMNTSFATLDALSEIINNHIFRRGRYALGLSSTLIGSGMAFDYALFKKTLGAMDAIGGFDRELHLKLTGMGYRAYYLEDAMVYDEKVDKAENFANQRRRWLSSQFVYLGRYFGEGFRRLFKGNIDFFDSAILGNIQPPRVILLGVLGIMAVLTTLLYNWVYISPLAWWGLLALNLAAFALAVPISFYNKRFFESLMALPMAFGTMFLSLFKLKGANKQFIHTPHGHVEVEGVKTTKS